MAPCQQAVACALSLTKIRPSVQEAFEECLSQPDYASFIAFFSKNGNNNRDFLKITVENDGLFPGPLHFWTDDGAVLPNFTPANVDALFPDHGAASGDAGQKSSLMARCIALNNTGCCSSSRVMPKLS